MVVWVDAHAGMLAAVSGAIGLIGFLVAIVALITAGRAKRKVRRRHPVDLNNPAVLNEVLKNEVEELQDEVVRLHEELATVRSVLTTKVDTPRIMRFNAFGNTGSDLSFAIAMVDEQKNGVVLSSIYGREESRMYAKPIENGVSSYPLTDEEMHVLTGAYPTEDSHRRRGTTVPQA